MSGDSSSSTFRQNRRLGFGILAFAFAVAAAAALWPREPARLRVWAVLSELDVLPPLTPDQAQGYLELATRALPPGCAGGDCTPPLVHAYLLALASEMAEAAPLHGATLRVLRTRKLPPRCTEQPACGAGAFFYEMRRALDRGDASAVSRLRDSPGGDGFGVRAPGELTVDELEAWRATTTSLVRHTTQVRW